MFLRLRGGVRALASARGRLEGKRVTPIQWWRGWSESLDEFDGRCGRESLRYDVRRRCFRERCGLQTDAEFSRWLDRNGAPRLHRGERGRESVWHPGV